jgi:DGQHR domain-containing protein
MEQKYHLQTHATLVRQRPPDLRGDKDFIKEHDFFVFSLSSDHLLQIAKFSSRQESKTGIQRVHQEDRDREIGRFISSDRPFFTKVIILNFPLGFEKSFFDDKSHCLDVKIPLASALVVDGQHRLKAFQSEYANTVVLPLVVAAYFDLELPTVAEIFTRINFFQKPVSKSLVYDLLDLNDDPDFKNYKEAHDIIEILNTKIGSPWYGLIKTLGVGRGLLSQAAFVEAYTSRYKIKKQLSVLSTLEDKADVIERYFKAIEIVFPGKWGEQSSVLSRTLGFNALMKSLQIILTQGKFDVIHDKKAFGKYAEAIKNINVDAEDIRMLGGYGGVNALASKFEDSFRRMELLKK